MLPATNRGVGMHIGFPDVCLTPVGPAVVPIPYPNFALTAQAVPFSPIVKVSGVNALNMISKVPMTFGDDAGVAHPVFKQMGQYVMGNPIVNIDRMPAINLLCPTTGNAMNNPVGAVLVPSAVNVFYTYRTGARGAYGGPIGLEGLQALAGSMRGAESESVSEEALPGDVAYMRVALFTADAPTKAWDAVRRFTDAGARALIIDVRGCPGGDLDAFARLAADFLPRGAALAHVTDADGDTEVIRVSRDDPFVIPLVVLIDGSTASAGELFAGCLKAHARAVLVGRATYGKGAAQKVGPANEGGGAGAVLATAALCALPGGEALEGAGVSPDVEVTSDGGELGDLTSDAALRTAWWVASRIGLLFTGVGSRQEA